jgi:hypothetical protein
LPEYVRQEREKVESKMYWFEGGFSDYEESYKKRVGDIVPKRLKYKKLVRG